MKTQLLERFLRYVAISSQSDAQRHHRTVHPRPADPGPPAGRRELTTLGLCDVRIDTHGILTARCPGATSRVRRASVLSRTWIRWMSAFRPTSSRRSSPLTATEPALGGGSHRGPAGRVLMAWSFAATMIDILVVFSLVCLFLFVSLLAFRLMSSPVALTRDSLTHLVIPLFVFLYSSYLILVRVFLGSSLGEWACGLRLGEARQRFLPDMSGSS